MAVHTDVGAVLSRCGCKQMTHQRGVVLGTTSEDQSGYWSTGMNTAVPQGTHVPMLHMCTMLTEFKFKESRQSTSVHWNLSCTTTHRHDRCDDDHHLLTIGTAKQRDVRPTLHSGVAPEAGGVATT